MVSVNFLVPLAKEMHGLQDPEPSAPMALLEGKPFPGFSYSSRTPSVQEWGSDTGEESCLSEQSRLCSRLKCNAELESKCRSACICLTSFRISIYPTTNSKILQKMLETKKIHQMLAKAVMYGVLLTFTILSLFTGKFKGRIPVQTLIYEYFP